MVFWNWFWNLWFDTAEPPKEEPKTVSLKTTENAWSTPADWSNDTCKVETVGAGSSSKEKPKKSAKKPKATIEGDAKLLYSSEDEKNHLLPVVLPTPPKETKASKPKAPKKGK